MINLEFTTPSSCNDSTRKSQFVLLLSIQVDVIAGPGFGRVYRVSKVLPEEGGVSTGRPVGFLRGDRERREVRRSRFPRRR